ncbi:LppU/SCO3897 family protein [Streptomyces anandii]|uniref:LppU/SCO3897 family protein n=1 Tax=Streptomyces anandii TaxID=285454 RepID=UPI0036AB5BBF
MTTPPPPQGQNPYAQAPTAPMGQQPGQPGVPQQPYAPFPQQQGAPVPPPPAPAKRGGKKALRIVGSIVVLIIVAGVKFGIGWWASETDAETTSVGSCMHNDGTDTHADLNEVDCSSGKAQYKVVQKFDGSTDENKCRAVSDATISYVQTGGGHDVVLCLKEAK